MKGAGKKYRRRKKYDEGTKVIKEKGGGDDDRIDKCKEWERNREEGRGGGMV
jgi:hypothetical protein